MMRIHSAQVRVAINTDVGELAALVEIDGSVIDRSALPLAAVLAGEIKPTLREIEEEIELRKREGVGG